MALRERLIYAIEVTTDKAQQGLKGFTSAVNNAEGATGKFKAGASSAMSTVGANAGLLAATGGAALVGFGVKAVESFEKGALSADKFAKASGLGDEAASRWNEVADDLGVSSETVAGSFVRLEKAISSNSPAIKALGLEVQRTKDGQVDANATMLEAIRKLGQVKDANDKAKYASQLFGRGFADAAQLLLGLGYLNQFRFGWRG